MREQDAPNWAIQTEMADHPGLDFPDFNSSGSQEDFREVKGEKQGFQDDFSTHSA